MVAQLSPDSFLVAGDFVRFAIAPRKGGPANGTMIRVEEGGFEGGRWITHRIWNGDQTDYGINIVDRPTLLKVTMGHYR